MTIHIILDEWKRVNSRMILKNDGSEWRTSTMEKLASQEIPVYDKHGNKRMIKVRKTPTFITKQGRLAREYRISKVNQFVYKKIVINKKVRYEIMRCLEKGCRGKIKYNEYEEMQCSACGIILEQINLRMIEKNDAVIPSSWNNTDLNFVSDISKEAKEHNDRIKRIIEWEKNRS